MFLSVTICSKTRLQQYPFPNERKITDILLDITQFCYSLTLEVRFNRVSLYLNRH